MLLIFLLFPELSQLEHLEPALVAEALSAPLDHFTVQSVVGWDVIHQLGIPGLYVSNHHQVCFDPLTQLVIVEAAVLNRRLVIETIFVPVSPGLLVTLINEVLDVIIGAVSEHGQKVELSLSLIVSFDLESLGTVDDIFRHPDLNTVLDDMIVETPGVKLLLLSNLISDLGL